MSRNKQPAQAKILKGNFRPDRDSHGPQVTIEAPKAPGWLPKEAKKYWKDIAPELVSLGLISTVDGAAFTMHCDSMGRYKDVCKKIKENGDKLTGSTPQGYAVQSALFTIRNKLWDQVLKSAREFGLTPAGRSVIKSSGQQQLPLGDEWDEL